MITDEFGTNREALVLVYFKKRCGLGKLVTLERRCNLWIKFSSHGRT
jgi:hypothetical protein